MATGYRVIFRALTQEKLEDICCMAGMASPSDAASFVLKKGVEFYTHRENGAKLIVRPLSGQTLKDCTFTKPPRLANPPLPKSVQELLCLEPDDVQRGSKLLDLLNTDTEISAFAIAVATIHELVSTRFFYQSRFFMQTPDGKRSELDFEKIKPLPVLLGTLHLAMSRRTSDLGDNQQDTTIKMAEADMLLSKFTIYGKSIPELRKMRDIAWEILHIAMAEDMVNEGEFTTGAKRLDQAQKYQDTKDEKPWLTSGLGSIRGVLTNAAHMLTVPPADLPPIMTAADVSGLGLPAWVISGIPDKPVDTHTKATRFIQRIAPLL